jgi:hypothetical protein
MDGFGIAPDCGMAWDDSRDDEATSMVRERIHTRKAFIRGFMALMAATLIICGLILMHLVSTNGHVTTCTSEVMRTPAVYLEHIGDEDKPIYPIVIATSRPNEQEFDCAIIGREWRSAEVFLVREEELAQVNKLFKGSKSGGERIAQPREFRYVLVSKIGTVESGILDPTQSHETIAALAAYFDGRQPELHEHLTSRRF